MDCPECHRRMDIVRSWFGPAWWFECLRCNVVTVPERLKR